MILPFFLLAGLLAAFAAVPVLIHLINMMRHRRVKWAAMDFLLASYKKHRNWIWLKQLFLLLARMSVMVLLALMLCLLAHYLVDQVRQGFGVDDEALSGMLGGKTTHHYVLLDDSYSMSDRAGGMTAFDRAWRATQMIATRASHHQNQRFTLIRYSQAIGASGKEESIDDEAEQIADLNAIEIDKEFNALLEERRNAFDVSQLPAGPVAAINLTKQLVNGRDNERPIVYLVSDYRAKEWDAPAEIQKSLQTLTPHEAEIHMIDCVKNKRQNLAITAIEPNDDIRAAGVPLFVNVTVKNFGDTVAKKVQVKMRSVFFDPSTQVAGDPAAATGEAEELPTVLLNEIPPGESATRRVQVFFPKPGRHVVEATLQEDTVATDNRRWCVVDFLEGVPVLVIDSDPSRRNAYYLAAAFEPGRKETGIRPDIQPVNFLRDAATEELRKYHTIYLLDVDRLDERAVTNLEEYVRAGGGLGVFVGPNVSLAFYDSNLYQEGKGLMPLPLDRDAELPEQIREKTPDIVPTGHPIFSDFADERNSVLRRVSIQRYLKPPIEWDPMGDSNVQVVAKLRSGDPLAVERQFGEGRVVTFLTTMAPDWHNWTGNPTFVIVALRLQAHLSSIQRQDIERVAGSPIQLQLDTEKFRKDVTFVVPGATEDRMMIERSAQPIKQDSPLLSATLGQSEKTNRPNGETGRSGVYESWAYSVEGLPEVQRYAVNVETVEGDLALSDSKSFLDKLEQLKPQYLHWDEINPDPVRQAGFNWSKWILLVLIVLLICEQILAYTCSFHPIQRGARQ